MLCKFTKLDIHFQKDRCALCYAFTYVWNNDAICISFGLRLGPGAKSGMQTMMKRPSLARRDSLFEKRSFDALHMVCAIVQFSWQFVSHGLCICAISMTICFTWFVQLCNFWYQFDVLHMVCAILQFPYVVGCWTLGEEMGMCNLMSEQVYGLKSMWDPIICPHPNTPNPLLCRSVKLNRLFNPCTLFSSKK